MAVVPVRHGTVRHGGPSIGKPLYVLWTNLHGVNAQGLLAQTVVIGHPSHGGLPNWKWERYVSGEPSVSERSRSREEKLRFGG